MGEDGTGSWAMTIGELAKKAGVGIQTVRYYERRRLLPEPERTRSGYRRYDQDDLARLEFVLRSKALGFTLSEIEELLELGVQSGTTQADVRRRAQAKLKTTREKIRDMQAIADALERLVVTCATHGDNTRCTLIHALGPRHRPSTGSTSS